MTQNIEWVSYNANYLEKGARVSINQDIHSLIDQLDAKQTAEVLDYITWLLSDEDTLTDEELEQVRLGEDEISRGEYVTLNDYLRRRGE
jgi:hypothetical protein